jgi:hypothetical protein
VVVAVVLIVSVVVAALVPVTLTELAEHVGGSLAFGGAVFTAQLKLTFPVNPPDGVTVMVLVFPVVAPALNVSDDGFALSANVAEDTFTVNCVVSVSLPEVPVTVTV